MKETVDVTAAEVEQLYQRLKREAESSGYYLNPDVDFTKELIRSLIINEKRYGYWACPCRLATGKREEDLDIICPCDYRDADVAEFNACYCALYVSQSAVQGKASIRTIPERRPTAEERGGAVKGRIRRMKGEFPLPVWRCKVCGYLCARDSPPEICPICKAKKDRFERFI